jgi:peptidoglycan/LPS O-acetylase OafA/YrhL
VKYSPPLDGLRAVAIGGVLVFHVFPEYLWGGFTGVDVFFVLSGFLITSIILHDIRKQSFSLREFYLRRIQRLVPNMIVTVLAVLALASLFLFPSAVRQVGRHGLWTIGNLSIFLSGKTSAATGEMPPNRLRCCIRGPSLLKNSSTLYFRPR